MGMFGFDFVPIVVSFIAAILGPGGIYLTLYMNRNASTSQHVAQTEKMDKIHLAIDSLVGGQKDLHEGQNILFSMIADVDAKVTKRTNKSKPGERQTVVMEIAV